MSALLKLIFLIFRRHLRFNLRDEFKISHLVFFGVPACFSPQIPMRLNGILYAPAQLFMSDYEGLLFSLGEFQQNNSVFIECEIHYLKRIRIIVLYCGYENRKKVF